MNPATSLDPVLRLLLIGTRDAGSPLSLLDADCALHIYTQWKAWLDDRLRFDGVYASVLSGCTRDWSQADEGTTILPVRFPPPRNLIVNMMPIRLGDAASVPSSLRDYMPLIVSCPAWCAPNPERDGYEGIAYLTVHESRVEEDGQAQRRSGLHTETPGRLHTSHLAEGGEGGTWAAPHRPECVTVAWGGGFWEGPSGPGESATDERRMYKGGIYMASTVSHSTRVWNCRVDQPETVVGVLGDMEHLRPHLGEGVTLQANELLWMTDATPHESMPLPKGTYRQYFRLVTSEVSVWYADHSTRNPLGVEPGPRVQILRGDKFAATQLAAEARHAAIAARAAAMNGRFAVAVASWPERVTATAPLARAVEVAGGSCVDEHVGTSATGRRGLLGRVSERILGRMGKLRFW